MAQIIIIITSWEHPWVHVNKYLSIRKIWFDSVHRQNSHNEVQSTCTIPQRKLLVVQFKLLAFFFSHSVHKTGKKKVEVNFRNTPTSWLGGQSRRNGQMTALSDDKVLKLQFIMSNLRYSSLRKQPTFCNSTTGFLTKRHLRNKCRIFILMMSH